MIAQRSISKLCDRLYQEARDRFGAKDAIRIPETIIELDYCLAWFLAGLANNSELRNLLAFKGGTALRRIYLEDYRFSEDLDFALTQPTELPELLKNVESLCREVEKENGVRFSVNPTKPVEHQRNDTFYLDCKGPLPREQKVKVDVTRKETLVFDLENQPVLKTYPEFEDLPTDRKPLVYSINEVTVEKLLAVTHKARREPRDLYDLWSLSSRGLIPDASEMTYPLQKKLESRDGRANDNLGELLKRAEDGLKSRWKSRLGEQVQGLPEFEECFREVSRQVSRLEKLRGELRKDSVAKR